MHEQVHNLNSLVSLLCVLLKLCLSFTSLVLPDFISGSRIMLLLCRPLAQQEFFTKPKFSHLIEPDDCLAAPCDVICLDMYTLQVKDLEVLVHKKQLHPLHVGQVGLSDQQNCSVSFPRKSTVSFIFVWISLVFSMGSPPGSLFISRAWRQEAQQWNSTLDLTLSKTHKTLTHSVMQLEWQFTHYQQRSWALKHFLWPTDNSNNQN